MKTLIITLTAACAVIAGYFGIRHFMHRDLAFTPVWKYVRNLLENLLHTEPTAALEVGTTPAKTTD
jgi:hypothetical protein